jgi:superfamily II DNA or RNA helicase/HKD family nuclease
MTRKTDNVVVHSGGGDLFIVDNSDKDWKVRDYLREWTEISFSFDIATGFFEIGSLLALDGHWQKLEKIRILMGDEVTARTKKLLLATLVPKITEKLHGSIESEKLKNDFLVGVPAIERAIRDGKIELRVYAKDKFHAKAYITHARLAVVGSSALVGSSNFTAPGLMQNIELNIQIRREVELLQEWYERHWDDAEDISAEILKTIEHQTRDYSPFEVYAKALQEYFRNREISVGEWERLDSKMFKVLDQYQKEGYQALIKISRQYGGAFLCDGVGLGKTFVGLMLIERLVMHERKRVMLLVPKSGRKPVWEAALKRYLPHLLGDFSNLVVFNHTDLNRDGEFQERFEKMREMADVVIIDEAHHFRNPGTRGDPDKVADSMIKGGEESKPSRYWKLYQITEGKTLFMLTATPVNNSLFDFKHMIDLFSRRQTDYFKAAPLGIHSMPGHIRKMEKDLVASLADDLANDSTAETNEAEAQDLLLRDPLFSALVVQRSRAYVRASQKQHGSTAAMFPVREDPKVAEYSIKKTYGNLLNMVEKAFNKKAPLFSLAMYYPTAYSKADDKSIDPFVAARQKQVVVLIRTLFLKRFESSAKAFETSCEALLIKLLAFMTKNSVTPSEKQRLARWLAQHGELIGAVQKHQMELFGDSEEQDDDIITPEMLEDVEELPRDEYKVEEMLAETMLDMDQLADFLRELQKLKPSQDDKLKALVKLLKDDKVLKKHKVMIFTEFMTTARYLKKELIAAGITGVDEVDSSDQRDRGDVLKQFAPYYNDSSSAKLKASGLDETRILIATDVLSEGLNLQDATRLINYDLHWNPVRLMQRIGRIDRRMNPEIEKLLIADHPDVKELRGKVAYWNFLPPDELDSLLALYGRVSHKTLRISKTLGIEGKKLLTPEDDFEALKDFTHAYEGETSPIEQMHLDFQGLIKNDPELRDRLNSLPGRLFSGKAHIKPSTRAVFLCYSLPAPRGPAEKTEGEEDGWSLDSGASRWYLYDIATEEIAEDAPSINNIVRCDVDTARRTEIAQPTLTEIRQLIEKHIKNTYLKQVQAPVGVKPVLKAWMELN